MADKHVSLKDVPEVERRPAYEEYAYLWNLGLLQKKQANKPDSGDKSKEIEDQVKRTGVFIVHGIGMQEFADTAVELRSGLDDVMRLLNLTGERGFLPPPYLSEGYWADYSDFKKTFPEDHDELDEHAQQFFVKLWKKRLLMPFATVRWLIRQQRRLFVSTASSCMTGLVYKLMQIPLLLIWLIGLFRFPKMVSGYLGDLRIYFDPNGVTERAVRQRIDFRVGKSFLRMLGLDWEFRSLSTTDMIDTSGKKIKFEKVIWVSHSLGTVISYNVLSDLFRKADEIMSLPDNAETKDQKDGVAIFRKAITNFITLGSPLDKVAHLFEHSLSPWPEIDKSKIDPDSSELCENWWVNFYHLYDPVSGALDSPLICARHKPVNRHTKLAQFPGKAHTNYWWMKQPLKLIVCRMFGEPFDYSQKYSRTTLNIMAMSFMLLVNVLSLATMLLLAYGIYNWREYGNLMLSFLGF